jgi:hypothetical protein
VQEKIVHRLDVFAEEAHGSSPFWRATHCDVGSKRPLVDLHQANSKFELWGKVPATFKPSSSYVG